jgi:V8-like Glu-specific endopeptidase
MKPLITHSLKVSLLIHLGCSLLLLTGCYNSSPSASTCLEQKTDEISNSIVYIKGESTATTSSGFIISASLKNNMCHFYVLTTKHSLDGIDNQEKFRLTTVYNEAHPIELVKSFKENDLAILRFVGKRKHHKLTLSDKIPEINSKVELVGSIKCHPEISKEIYQLQKTDGTIQNRADLDNIEFSKKKFYSLKTNPSNYEQIKNKDLYYTNAAVSGMSGSPLLNNLRQVIGIQQISLTPQLSTDNCTKPPTNHYSMGTSMQKFLSQDIPSEVREGFNF